MKPNETLANGKLKCIRAVSKKRENVFVPEFDAAGTRSAEYQVAISTFSTMLQDPFKLQNKWVSTKRLNYIKRTF